MKRERQRDRNKGVVEWSDGSLKNVLGEWLG